MAFNAKGYQRKVWFYVAAVAKDNEGDLSHHILINCHCIVGLILRWLIKKSFALHPYRTENGPRRSSREARRARSHHLEAQSSAIQERHHERAGMGTSCVSIRDFEWVTFASKRHTHTFALPLPLFLLHHHKHQHLFFGGPSFFPFNQTRNRSVLIQLSDSYICTRCAVERPIQSRPCLPIQMRTSRLSVTQQSHINMWRNNKKRGSHDITEWVRTSLLCRCVWIN